jgi:predicted AlkP superfamily pyrophosphatase or phosphodiesterase
MTRFAVLAAALLLGATNVAAQRAAPDARPTLVVLITVDQMRADYLERFASQLDGGLARLVRGGANFTNAHQDHAITETAPGHASLLSGRFPRSTGILSNGVGVQDGTATLLDGATDAGASPEGFRGTTLVDWLHAADRRSRALSVSAKDRSAILPVGRARQHVYWYVPDGRFVTSRYYADSLPTWLRRFNARELPRRRAGDAWRTLLPAAAYPERDSVAFEAGGSDTTFPHRVPADSAEAASYVRVTPWIDEIVLALALDGLTALQLGAGPQTDVLSVSLSATDFIGHRYGPDSREIHDQIVRLDRSLGVFLDSLLKLRDSSRVAIVLTADHGMGRIPELAGDGTLGGPLRVDLAPALLRARAALRVARVDEGALWLDGGVLGFDRAALARRRVDPAAILALAVADARRIPGVLRVDRWADLVRGGAPRDAIARRWTHQFPPAAAIEAVVTLTPGSIYGYESIATHGTPHDYDSHVPLVFYGAAFRPARHGEFVRTVDIAPTLAAITGVRPAEAIDGTVLRRALR